jgi:hypothetical protein
MQSSDVRLMRRGVLAVRDDEANHRDVNHASANQLADRGENLDSMTQTLSLEHSLGR